MKPTELITKPAEAISYMVHVEGETTVPITVTAVVAFGFVTSALLLQTKPWATSLDGAWDTPSEAVTRSNFGGPKLLLLYRAYLFIHTLIIGSLMVLRRGKIVFAFYTNWSFFLEIAYFGITAVSSAVALRRKPRGTVGYVGYTIIVLFHVTLAATIIVDVLTWTVLWPMLSRNPDPVAVAYFREQFLCWTSYNTHILNAVFMFGELFLNDIPFTPYLMGAVGFYSSAYALWAFSFYKATNRWIYPFINANKPWAPYVYIGIYLGHWLFFGIVAYVFKLKHWMLGKPAAPKEDVKTE